MSIHVKLANSRLNTIGQNWQVVILQTWEDKSKKNVECSFFIWNLVFQEMKFENLSNTHCIGLNTSKLDFYKNEISNEKVIFRMFLTCELYLYLSSRIFHELLISRISCTLPTERRKFLVQSCRTRCRFPAKRPRRENVKNCNLRPEQQC